MSGRVLIVDDDVTLCRTIADGLTARGMSTLTAFEAAGGLALLEQSDVDVVLTDFRMPGQNGIELCARVSEMLPDVPVIVLTAFGDFESAVAAIRAGAYDFLSKPAKLDAIEIAVRRALQHRALGAEVRRLRIEVGQRGGRVEGILAQSPAMQDVVDLIARVGTTATNVLVTGESGTGKEVVARALHVRSGRKGPFVGVNCAAMPETLLESELFGHGRGAFTDAKETRLGLFREANGGTLFLDEIGDMPLGLQPKLLRVLQERRVRPIGGAAEHPVDVRIVAATNRDLETAIEEGRFREDLYFRLNVVHIALPQLRARKADILPLAHLFLEKHAERSGRAVSGISPPAAEKLLAYPWQGNVRELQNCIERAVALTRFEQIGIADLPDKIRAYQASDVLVVADDPTELAPLEEVERRYIVRVMDAVGGNKTAAARILGIERKTLYRKLDSYKVKGNATS